MCYPSFVRFAVFAVGLIVGLAAVPSTARAQENADAGVSPPRYLVPGPLHWTPPPALETADGGAADASDGSNATPVASSTDTSDGGTTAIPADAAPTMPAATGTDAGIEPSTLFAPPPPPGVNGVEPPAVGFPQPGRPPSLMRARLRMLNTLLPGIAQRSRENRVRDGIIQLAVGSGFFALGWVSFALTPAGSPPIWPYIFASSGVSVFSGILTLAWAPARERLSDEFARMPMSNSIERRARTMFGERALDDMAADSRLRRTLEGVVSITATLALLGAMYWDPIFNSAHTTRSISVVDGFIIGLGGFSIITSIVSMFARTEEERLRDAYHQHVRVLQSEQANY